MDVLDFLGNVIKEGDQIVWPNRQGSMMWMNTGHVAAIGTDDLNRPVLQVDRQDRGHLTGRRSGKTKRVEIHRTDRVVALGRWENFLPMKEPNEFRDMPKPFKETWLDRVMQWIRDRG